MIEPLNNFKMIREYLLGRILDEEMLAQIEELLFTDDNFCTKTQLAEDELINDFVLKNLNEQDLKDFEKTLVNNTDRRLKVQLTQKVREKALIQNIKEKNSVFDSIKAFFQQPAYVGALAVLLIVIIAGLVLLTRQSNNSELAELKNIYQKERPFEMRISEFDYAPYEILRGGNDKTEDEKRRLNLLEKKLLEATVNNPIAVNHHALGVFYLTQGNFKEAIKELLAAIKLDDKNAKFYNDLGSSYLGLAKTENNKNPQNLYLANESFSKSIELNPNLLEALFNKSLSLQELKLYRQAKESWELYLQKDSNSKWADEARKNLEKIVQMQSGIKKSKETVLADFFVAYRNRDEKIVWKIHNSTKGLLTNISLTSQLTRRFLEAKKSRDDPTAQESIEALIYIGKLEKEVHADFFFADLADYYTELDDKKIAKAIDAIDLWTDGYKLITGKAADSIEKFEQSKAVFQQIGNEIEMNIAELWSSQMLIYNGKLAESSKRMEHLLEYSKKKNYKTISSNLYYWLSICDFRQANFSRSIKNVKSAFLLSEEIENLYEIQHSAENLANGYGDFGEIEKSVKYVVKAIDDSNLYYSNTSQTWRNLNTVTKILGKTEYQSTAIDFAKESFELSKIVFGDKTGVNDSLRYVTKAFSNARQYEKALHFANYSNDLALKREQTPQNQKIIADTYFIRGNLKREMDLCSEAIEDYKKADEYYRQVNQVINYLYELEKGKLLCFDKLERKDEFQKELERVLILFENNRKNIREDSSRQAFFENEQQIFDLAISNSLSENNSQKAFEYTETSKARSLLEFVRSKESIAEVENNYGNIAKSLTLTEIQNQIPENVQIVEYSVLPNKLAIWIITKNRFELVEKQISNEQLNQKINDYRKLIVEKIEKEKIKHIAQDLYNLLIPNSLDRNKVLCVIPDKSLFQLPFASLISTENKYLLEDFPLIFNPSSSIFIAATQNAALKEKNESLLIVGNPKFDREENPNLEDLPDAEIESKEIAKNYAKFQKYIGEEATKKNFLENLENAEIIHFAGHYVANSQTLSNSRMLFSDEDLYPVEFSEKKLPKAKLVVLSACETGFEKLNNSEGSIGIARTFLAMGTSQVLASNWKISSAATKDLMISFHQKRRLGKLSNVEALRQSQIEMMQKSDLNSPFYWSAFTLTGGLVTF